jgi:membrane-bound lytic murein transglycosylase D
VTIARHGAALACLTLVASGCAHGKVADRSASTTAVQRKPADPVSRLIAAADAHLAKGLAESKQGHLGRARGEFDRAVDLYLGAPGGAYATPRLAEAYRRTLETIQVHELEVLAAGDGFTETPAEPASIDDLQDLTVPPAPNEDVRRLAIEAVQGESNDLPIELNDDVLACIDLYQGPLREWFAAALERGGRYLPRIRQVFAEEGVPQDLAYLALVESAFKTGALSRAKAKGVWQFIPETGRRFGLTQDWWVDERSNPEKSTRAAARFLRQLHDTFGDWNLAMAGYNWGPGRVSRALERTGAGDYWGIRSMGTMPRETRNYVPMIHAAVVVAKAPEKYGFEITPEPLLEYDTVPMKDATDLRVIAECLGRALDDVQLLNPELRRLATPAGRTFPLKVPKGHADGLQQCLTDLPPSKRVTFRTHTVARGQTLSSVARIYGAKVADVAAANNLGSGKRLARGAELIIPVARTASVGRPAVPRATRTANRSELTGGEPVRISYRIKAGDTLTGIASRYGTTIRELMAWNKLRGTRLAAGHTLTVYTQP